MNEGDGEAHNLLGFILGQQGDLETALVHLQRAVTILPESSGAHYNLGVALWYGGSKDKAIGELRESIRLDPARAEAMRFSEWRCGTAVTWRGRV